MGARTRAGIRLTAMTVTSPVLAAVTALSITFPVTYAVMLACSYLGIELPAFGEFAMVGPFLAGIGGFLFGVPLGAIAWLLRSVSWKLRRILIIVAAMTVAALGVSICYWGWLAPRATVPETSVIAAGVVVTITVGLAVGVSAAILPSAFRLGSDDPTD
ncbi:MAG TPA: hypothetical protein VMX74_00290 [Pirellulales bacterium]|nr:hypothetical protein [Pirellulales bacterium]